MNEIANQLVQALFKKNSLQECSRWELEILADKYPYFGVAQLLVSGKLKEENTEAYEKQVQKTSLYFTNPLWLDYILNKQPPPENITQEKKEINDIEDDLKTASIISLAPENTIVDQQGASFFEEAIAQQDNEQTNEINTEENSEAAVELKTEAIVPEPEIKNNEYPVAINESVAQATGETDNEQASEAEKATDTPIENNNVELKIAPLRIEPLNENTPLAFEPFHTVDYFASQGIKLSLEEKPQDKFGQQLKSFTQWLKTIKKVPAEEIAKEAAKNTDQKVTTLAEHSLEDRDVVTETMAEVWAKQGNRQKAIEVYRKLSLQNPSKSSYFAGLIEQLKQH